jgi:hypothetical protein
MTALEEYEQWSEDTRDWTPTEGRILADAAIESLKCCGNCGHYMETSGRCDIWLKSERFGPETCHFTPSRWKERT